MLSPTIEKLLADANRLDVKASVENATKEQLILLQSIADKAGEIFDCPISQITLLDENIQNFLISNGADLTEASTQTSFCAHALANTDPVFVVYDASNDPRFSSNPFVVDGPNIRFYVGCPIVLNFQRIGTVCLYDFEPREGITREQTAMLIDLTWDAAMILQRGPIS